MGKIIAEYLDKLDDPIFDSSYEIYTPKKILSNKSKEKDKKVLIKKNTKLKKKNNFCISPDLET